MDIETVRSSAMATIAQGVLNRQQNLPRLMSSDYYWWRKRREVRSLIARNIHRFSHGATFIELGCGRARDLWSVRKLLDAHFDDLRYVGADGDPQQLELCVGQKEHYGAHNVDFITCDITKKLPWETESIDFVYTSEVMEHIPEAEAVFLEVRRILRPEGHFLMTTPNEPNLFQRSFYSKKHREEFWASPSKPVGYGVDGVPLYGHINLRKNSEWDAILAQEGFRLVDVGRGAIWYGHQPWRNSELSFGLQLIIESILDALPRRWTRNISDQLIALYQRD